MKRVRFQASFTGLLSKLDGMVFKPPFRIEQDQHYELEIDPTTGRTEIVQLRNLVTCAGCGRAFFSDRDAGEVECERATLYPNATPDECRMVCDECFGEACTVTR